MIKSKGGNFVKSIKEGDIIHIDERKVELIEENFKILYDDNINNHKIKNNYIFDFESEINYALDNLSKGKVWGLDGISDDAFKTIMQRIAWLLN